MSIGWIASKNRFELAQEEVKDWWWNVDGRLKDDTHIANGHLVLLDVICDLE